MSSLSSKSEQEIADLLDEMGIKHGPVVDSTRSLYEKKIREAMAKGKKAKPPSDKTFYREEEEEVTFLSYKTPRSDGSGDSGSHSRFRPEWNEREYDRSFTRSRPEWNESKQEESFRSSRPEWTEREQDRSFLRSRPVYDEREQERSYKSFSRPQPDYSRRNFANEPDMYDTPSTYRSSYLKSTPVKPAQEAPPPAESSRLVPLWVQFLFFLAVAVFLYIVFSNMETNEQLKVID
ncbi:emerin-like [Xyrichtys novacula]|uniref:Emerin-like n=1 Tax=Xyrichtys novacula TaxID=13765 RepID=A0AAV1HKZ5_XYRNO|nr:emerin-like [Xyrichtys novacula]